MSFKCGNRNWESSAVEKTIGWEEGLQWRTLITAKASSESLMSNILLNDLLFINLLKI
jgi:hypothetical protein